VSATWPDEADIDPSGDLNPRVAQLVSDVQAAIALVAAGLGISPVPAAIQVFKRKGVVYRPLRPHTLRFEMGLA
jgi:DNA-binding transcriptional LysR family regulator